MINFQISFIMYLLAHKTSIHIYIHIYKTLCINVVIMNNCCNYIYKNESTYYYIGVLIKFQIKFKV